MIDGLEVDVVTLALAYDIDAIAEKVKLPRNITPFVELFMPKNNTRNRPCQRTRAVAGKAYSCG